MQRESSPADSSLDFLSPQFSAEKALDSSPSRIQLPCPEVPPCDNLEQYASVVRGISRRPQHAEAAARSQREPEERQMRAPAGSRERLVRTVKSVISTIETPASGPLALVQRCREKGVRVRVAVRHCAGVRGEVEGRVLAFDRHINLVLGDVSEKFTPLRTVTNGGVQPRSQRRRNKHKNTTCVATETELHRHLDKLFIRGDNVVLLSPVTPLEEYSQRS